jgi:hypothetical protein
MSDLSDKMWEEYLEKSNRDVLRRVIGDLRAAQAGLMVVGNQLLYDEVNKIAIAAESILKELYEEPK